MKWIAAILLIMLVGIGTNIPSCVHTHSDILKGGLEPQ